jgi:hypothetical protein
MCGACQLAFTGTQKAAKLRGRSSPLNRYRPRNFVVFLGGRPIDTSSRRAWQHDQPHPSTIPFLNYSWLTLTEEMHMTTDTETASPSPSPATKKGPGRPRSSPETPQQRIERLQAELQQAHEAKKLVEQKQALIVGMAVIHRSRADENYRPQLAAILRDEIKSKTDLAAIADLLNEPSPPSPSAP